MNLRTLSPGQLAAYRAQLENRVLSEHKREKLARRRIFRGRALKRLAADEQARPLLKAVAAEWHRRHYTPIDAIELLDDATLVALRAEANEDLLSPYQYRRAILSGLGSFDGDRALEADERGRCVIGQIDREWKRRHPQPQTAATIYAALA
jgi:hypothetical protein